MATDRNPSRDGALQEWAERGLRELRLLPIYAAPVRPRTGVIVYADGVEWNPGSGEGPYIYDSGGNWVFLG